MEKLNLSIDKIIQILYQELPPIFARKEVPKLLGGVISAGTLANLACEGYGAPSINNSKNIIYEKQSFLEWFKIYLEGGIKALKKIKNE